MRATLRASGSSAIDGEEHEATIEDYSIVRSEGVRVVERQMAQPSIFGLLIEDGALEKAATCNDYLQVRTGGWREVSRKQILCSRVG